MFKKIPVNLLILIYLRPNFEILKVEVKALFQITRKAARIELKLDVKKIGEDYMLTLTGGEEHIGAVATGLFDKESSRASSSVITLPGHREDQLALQGARQVSKATHRTAVFVVGMHQENITLNEIKEIVSVAEKMVQDFIDFYEKQHEAERKK